MFGVNVRYHDWYGNFNSNVYSYRCRLNDVQPGDLVLVDARGELKIARVEKITDDPKTNGHTHINYKEVIVRLPSNLTYDKGKWSPT